ncbi:MAG: ribosome maturation factor RimM [Pseudanabaenaceae cyanobacterium]
MDEWLVVGKIVASQGLKGEVRILSYSDFPERFQTPGQRWIRATPRHQPQPIDLIRGYPHAGKRNIYIVTLAGITTCEQAEKLRNYDFLVPATDRPHLEPDEFYVADLIDCQVWEYGTEQFVGRVVSVVPAGNDLLEIETETGTYLVPFVMDLVPIVDLTNRRIEIKVIPGLLS